MGFLEALEALLRTPRRACWTALEQFGAPPEATPTIDPKARITMREVWGPLTDTVNSICNQYTGISVSLAQALARHWAVGPADSCWNMLVAELSVS